MRVSTLLQKGRLPPKEYTIPFKEITPLQLHNEVSGRGEKTSDVSCLQEMAVLFACLKKNEFKEAKCSDEVTTFFECYNTHKAEKIAAKKREESGKFVPGRNPRSLPTKQLNQLLSKYPQFNEKLR